MVCDWLCEDFLTVQRKARQHTRKTGHSVSMELGYDVKITANIPISVLTHSGESANARGEA